MWTIGNGESRIHIDVKNLEGLKVGCNAILRDHYVDHLVCVDRRMVQEAVDKHINDKTIVYTRPEWLGRFETIKNIKVVPNLPYKGQERWDEPFQWGSGPYAVLISAQLSNTVNLLGFDLYSKNKFVNNIYKGTISYDAAEKTAVDPRYWIHQIGMVFGCFPEVTFKIYQNDDWVLPKAWNHPNVLVDKISNLSYNT